jgi:hypothetical protein
MLLDNFLSRRRRPRFLHMPVLAMRAIRAKPHVMPAIQIKKRNTV